MILKLLLAICLCLSYGCEKSLTYVDSPADEKVKDSKLIKIVATVGMVADLVEKVAGKRAQVSQIMGAGVDPHLYKSTRDDVRSMMSADMVFYSGLSLEGKMTDTLLKLAREKPVVAVTQKLDPNDLLAPAEATGHPDPHVWMDVSAWAKCIGIVEESLTKFAPQYQEEFQKNAAAYHNELSKLHTYGILSLQTIPAESRLLITSHDAFNYFGRAYNLQVKGVQGISTESEAGLLHVNHLVDEIVQKKIKAIFVESSVSQKSIEAIIEGVRMQGHDIIIGGVLFSDAMGEKGTYEGTYIGMLDHNITLVTIGLGGSCPEKGLNGKLSYQTQHR
jgi:manganese/zinc/iron transport system substrate-binding protein